MNLDRIKELISKLLVVSKDKAAQSTEEAALAAEKAQKLMFDYNLSLDDVDLEEKTKLHMEDPIDDSKGLFSIPRWKISLSSVIAQVNFSRSIIFGFGSKDPKFTNLKIDSKEYKKLQELFTGTINVVGKKKNVQAVKYMYASICKQIEDLAQYEYEIFVRKNSKAKTASSYNSIFGHLQMEGILSEMFSQSNENPESEKNWKNSFIYGLSKAISSKLLASFNQMKNSAGEQALVRVSKDAKEADDFINDQKYGKMHSSQDHLNTNAARNGMNSVDRININQNNQKLGMGMLRLKE